MVSVMVSVRDSVKCAWIFLLMACARPGLKRGPAAHTVLRNRNAMSHATSKRHPPPGLVYVSHKKYFLKLEKNWKYPIFSIKNIGYISVIYIGDIYRAKPADKALRQPTKIFYTMPTMSVSWLENIATVASTEWSECSWEWLLVQETKKAVICDF